MQLGPISADPIVLRDEAIYIYIYIIPLLYNSYYINTIYAMFHIIMCIIIITILATLLLQVRRPPRQCGRCRARSGPLEAPERARQNGNAQTIYKTIMIISMLQIIVTSTKRSKPTVRKQLLDPYSACRPY